jgi:hypothetical protein
MAGQLEGFWAITGSQPGWLEGSLLIQLLGVSQAGSLKMLLSAERVSSGKEAIGPAGTAGSSSPRSSRALLLEAS